MTGRHLEIERKFDVEPGFALPDLTDVDGVAAADAPVEHDLEAVYHDTGDLRLARARVTLRRRTGGADAGWHLKLPASAGARQEVHEPLGRTVKTPPRPLRDLVLGITRGAPTAPVTTLRTRRLATVLRDADGRALAEIADDTVSATLPAAAPGGAAEQRAWRELEVELVDGDEELLGRLVERVLAAGARVSPSPSKLSRALGDRLAGSNGAGRATDVPAADDGSGKGKKKKKDKAKKKQKSPATGADVVLGAVRGQLDALRDADLMIRTGQEDAVHKFRVACRRLRSILAAFRPVLDRTATDPLRDELRWLGEQLSDARDGEVALAHLSELVAAQPPELVPGPVAARLQQSRLKEELRGGEDAARTIADPRYLRLVDALHALVADPPLAEKAGEPSEDVLRAAVRRSGRRLLHRIDDARQASPDGAAHALHESRNAAKRVRYTAEVAAGPLGAPAKALVDCMEHVQDVLGDHQDTEITQMWCERLGREAFAAGENPFAFGRLHALEQARADAARAEFWELEPSLHPVLRAAKKKS
jgi:CHAD domain-containing protein